MNCAGWAGKEEEYFVMTRGFSWPMKWVAAAWLALLTATGVLAGQSFEATAQGFLWKQGENWIRFNKAKWSAGINGGGSIQWNEFLWHDHYLYETLAGGKIEAGPVLQPDGSLLMQGTFSSRDKSSPVHYAYRLQAAADGVHVRCEFRKTGPLLLNRGIWIHIHGDRDKLAETARVWAEPSAFGTVASRLHSVARDFHIELQPGNSVYLGGPGLHEIEAESPQNRTYRLNLIRDDFATNQTVVAEYHIKVGALPAIFPGEIRPSNQPLAIHHVEASAAQVPQFEELELKVDLKATYQNPYDPDQIRLDAEFVSPTGKKIEVPGFFMVHYNREVQQQAELLSPLDNGSWRVRFAPREIGRYTWRLTLQDRSGKITGGEGEFTTVAPQTPGFVRRSSVDPHYLAFENGQGYFPIGHNLPTYHVAGQVGDEAMRKFAAAKENYNRWWMHSDGFGLEWCEKLGWYRQDAAARLDVALDVARQKGLYYMLCMDTHQDFRQQGWERNPFNAKNGGPCATVADWFTNQQAKDYYRKRLRYTVARWAYSPNVLCWEFGNEIEGWDKSPDTVKLPWHKEMADYLRALDPFGHLITTSFWTNTGNEDYWKLDNMDIVQTHLYTGNDAGVAPQVHECCLRQHAHFEKPHIFGEFGIRAGAGTPQKDPQGWAIHNGLWAGLFSFAAGGPMPWWHEDYLDKLNLYFHFTALANFVADLPLGTARWSEPQLMPPDYQDKQRPPELRDVIIAPSASGWTKPEYNEFTVLGDGSIAGDRKPPQLLHGAGHRDLRSPPTFVVNYPRPGKFVVRVGRVSRSGLLKVWIDDQEVLSRDLPCAEGLKKESIFRPQYKLWETLYDEDFTVPVPAGQHRIRVDNGGKDWVTVSRYVFTGCRVVDRPDVLVYGMTTDKLTLLWLQNRESTWFNHAGGGAVGQIAPFRVGVSGLSDGHYRIQWWETWKGSVQRETEADVIGGKLMLDVPALQTDVAVKICPQKQSK